MKESANKSNRDNAIIEAFLPLTIGSVALEDYLVATTRRSVSPPPSPYADFAYMDDDLAAEEKSTVRATSNGMIENCEHTSLTSQLSLIFFHSQKL